MRKCDAIERVRFFWEIGIHTDSLRCRWTRDGYCEAQCHGGGGRAIAVRGERRARAIIVRWQDDMRA